MVTIMNIEKLLEIEPIYLYSEYGVIQDQAAGDELNCCHKCILKFTKLTNYKLIGFRYNDKPEDYYGSGIVFGYDYDSAEFFIITLSHCSCYNIFDWDAWDDADDFDTYSGELLLTAIKEERLCHETIEFIEHCMSKVQ